MILSTGVPLVISEPKTDRASLAETPRRFFTKLAVVLVGPLLGTAACDQPSKAWQAT